MNIQTYLNIAIKAANEAGRLILDNFGKEQRINYKGKINIVTETDIASEQQIVSIIKSAYPNHNILTEETKI